MHTTDIILLVPLLWGLYRGFRRGIIGELAGIIAIFAIVYCSLKFSGIVSAFFVKHFYSEVSSTFLSSVSFVIIFVTVLVIVYFLSGRVEKLIKALHIGSLNHILGAIFGALKWALIVSLVIYSINKVQGKLGIAPVKFDQTWTYRQLQAFAPNVMPFLIKEGKTLAE